MPALIPRELELIYGSIQVDSVAAASGGNTVYTLETSQPSDWIRVGASVGVHSATNAVNNGTFQVISLSGVTLTLSNANGVVEASNSPAVIGVSVGGSSDYHLHGFFERDKDYNRINIGFGVKIIGAASDDEFDRLTAALEEAFRTPFQRLRITASAVVQDDFDPVPAASGNTGFNQQPSIVKLGGKSDSARSREYKVEVGLELPADLVTRSGRRTANVRVDFDENRRRTVSINGRYTALTSNDATAQYNGSIAAYATSVLAGFGGGATYDLISESHTADDEDKNLDFTRVFREVIYPQSAAGLNDPAITDPSFDYSRQQIAPGDSDSGARRLEIINIVFTSGVDLNETTDLESLWQNTVLPYILSEAQARFSLNAIAVTERRVTLSKASNRLTAALQIVALGDSDLIQYTRTVEITDRTGKVLVSALDGNPLSKHVYSGPGNLIRVTTEIMLLVEGGSSGIADIASAGNWVLMATTTTHKDIWMGLEDNQLQFEEVTTVTVEEWADTPEGATAPPEGTPTSSISAATGLDVTGAPAGGGAGGGGGGSGGGGGGGSGLSNPSGGSGAGPRAGFGLFPGRR